MFLLGLYGFIVSLFTLLDVTSCEKSIVILVPTLRKKKFVSLFGSIVKLRHAAPLFARGLCVFHPENKTKYCLSVLGNFSLLARFWIRRRINLSNEMPTVFVGLVHFHGSVFIEERLLFFGKLVRFTGTERYAEGGTHQQQSERSFVHAECSRRRSISFRHLGAEKNGRLRSD